MQNHRRESSRKLPATLVYDVKATIPFGGSCGLVARSLRHSLRDHDHAVHEMLVPVRDKTSAITLPRRGTGSERGVHVVFEELFPRCVRNEQFLQHPSLVFFNLAFFRVPEHCSADGLIFNSRYLMDCFGYEAFTKNVTPPPMTYASLELPLHDFPDGYPSYGARMDRRALGLLADQVYLGHALRSRKFDCFAMLSIIHHLNQLADARSSKRFLLLVPALDFPALQAALREMPIPADTIESFLPVGHLDNRSVVSVMRLAKFSLCYDTFVEAFGFYPVESVYCGCPVFTNGSGNLRHLLPADAGIEVSEDLRMYFGPVDARIRAYRRVAERVFHVVTEGGGPALCRRGARYIDQHYSRAAFAQQIGRMVRAVHELRRTRAIRKPPADAARVACVSPYLRIADWRRGRFVTDLGQVEVAPELAARWKQLLSATKLPPQLSGSAIPRSIGALRGAAAL
jgi:hypothetical protein